MAQCLVSCICSKLVDVGLSSHVANLVILEEQELETSGKKSYEVEACHAAHATEQASHAHCLLF